MTHVKPTKEELEEGIKKVQEELEKPEETPETPEVTPEEDPEETPEETPEEITEDETEETEEEPEQKEEKQEVDYKKKFSESSREALKIRAKDRRLNKGIDEAISTSEPTDEELQAEFSDWDVMSETEKRLARESLINKRFREKISQAREEAKKIEKWNDEVDTFVEDPKTLVDYPDLEGKIEEFQLYATEDEHNSVPFKLLVSAFLHEQSSKKTKHKGAMFEKGTGGSNKKEKTTDKKLTLDEAAVLMKTNYNKYKEYLLAGKIANL